MATRFYTNGDLMRGEVVLDGPEAHHLVAVCRHRPGDRVCLFNGDGRDYPAEIVSVSKKHVVLVVEAGIAVERELPYPVEVAAPVPKGDRGDFLIEKLTEIGVSTFVPLRTSRSVVEPRDTKLDRLRQRVIEASKQCGRNVLMEIRPLIDWDDYCQQQADDRPRYIAHPGGALGLAPLTTGVTFALGPEGGFTDAEVEQAVAAGWQPLGLGSRILRIETAALVVAAWAAQTVKV